MSKERFFVAQIGRTVGLHGELKFHLHTDFPEQFTSNAIFDSDRGKLEINQYNQKRGTISFIGFGSLDLAKKLTNTKLYSSHEQTDELCKLEENEYFWFDIIGMNVYERKQLLGVVGDIDRIQGIDYLSINTNENLVKSNKMPKDFLIPYIPRYILEVDKGEKSIIVKDALEILEAS